MEISIHELRACLDRAAEFTERYNAYVGSDANNPRKSRDDLLKVAREYTAEEIEIFLLDEPLKHETIYGFCVKEEKGYSILLSTGLPEDLTRFVLCKELFHVMIDGDVSSRNPNVCDHLEQVVIAFPVADSKPGKGVVSELLAEIGAMEFLFPYKARMEELASAAVDFQAIATKYLIPQYLVEIYLHPSYITELGAMVRDQSDDSKE
jgi:hypothetical protein